jgi:hypothetical protein
MRPGTRHVIGAATGIVMAAAITVFLLAGEYEATLTQTWATTQGPAGLGPSAMATDGPVSAARAAALILVAAVAVGALCGWRRLSPAAPLAAGLPLAGLGLLTWFDTYRATLLFGGSIAMPWSRLVTDQVFGVLGCVLLIAALAPGRRQPDRTRAGRPVISRRWLVGAIVLGLAAIPVVWYLVQLTNLNVADYLGSYWWPFHQSAGPFVDFVFVLLIAAVGVLASSRTFRITAVMAGLPMLALGTLALLAPAAAAHLISSAGLGPTWRYSVLLDVMSGLPLLYGGILVTAGLMPSGPSRLAATPAAARAARRAAS